MPLAGEKDFAGCVAKMKSEGYSDDVAHKVCGKIEAETKASVAEEFKNSKLSPSIKDLKEVSQVGPIVKAWEFNPDDIFKSSRKVTGTFHVPKIDKDREIITKAAMTEAIPDFMHLPILHDFHKERVLGLVTKVWEEADAFHFEALFKATHDVDDAWDKVKKGHYDHVSIYGSRLQGSPACGLDPSQRAVPCISNKIRLDSISACDEAARNDASSLKLAKAFVIESEDGEVNFKKAETSEGLIHGTYDGVTNGSKKKGGTMRVREVDEDDDRYKEDEEEKADVQAPAEQSKVVTKGDYDINGMFNRILDVLHKLVSSDKKVHSEMDKAEIDKAEDEEEESPVVTKGPEKRFQKGEETDWMKKKEGERSAALAEGRKRKDIERRSGGTSELHRFNKCEPCMKKSGDNMVDEVKEEIKKAEVPEVKPKEMTDEEFVQEIVKANLEGQTKSLQEFMKAQTDTIQKAIDKLSAMEERIKKVEEQPIQKAAVVISEQINPTEGYGALNYKAIQR
jgi:hypothetical protein